MFLLAIGLINFFVFQELTLVVSLILVFDIVYVLLVSV